MNGHSTPNSCSNCRLKNPFFPHRFQDPLLSCQICSQTMCNVSVMSISADSHCGWPATRLASHPSVPLCRSITRKWWHDELPHPSFSLDCPPTRLWSAHANQPADLFPPLLSVASVQPPVDESRVTPSLWRLIWSLPPAGASFLPAHQGTHKLPLLWDFMIAVLPERA